MTMIDIVHETGETTLNPQESFFVKENKYNSDQCLVECLHTTELLLSKSMYGHLYGHKIVIIPAL